MLRGEVSQRRGWRCWRGGTLHASTSLCLRRLLHVIAGPLPAVCALCQLPHVHSLPGGCPSPPVLSYAMLWPIHVPQPLLLPPSPVLFFSSASCNLVLKNIMQKMFLKKIQNPDFKSKVHFGRVLKVFSARSESERICLFWATKQL